MRSGSAQRNCIIEFMRENYSHPTAYEIFENVQKQFPKVSLGTVYRNLDYLTQTHVLKKVQKVGAIDRYDYVREHHNHAMCSRCGKIFDFNFPLDKGVLQSAVGDKIFIEDADFLIVGLCADCKETQKNNN